MSTSQAIEIDPPATSEAPETLYVRVVENYDGEGIIEVDSIERLGGTEPCELYEYRLVRKLLYTPSFTVTEIE